MIKNNNKIKNKNKEFLCSIRFTDRESHRKLKNLSMQLGISIGKTIDVLVMEKLKQINFTIREHSHPKLKN